MPLGDERGFTVVETMVASALMLVVLAGVLATLTTAYKTQVFAQRESEALDSARTALAQFQRDLAGSSLMDDVTGTADCPSGARCLKVTRPLHSGGVEELRYRIDGSVLKRDVWDVGTGSYRDERLLHSSLANLSQSPVVPFFACTAGHVNVALIVKPNPGRVETFRINNEVQTRNNNGSC